MMKCALASRAAHTLENWPSSTTRYKTQQPTHAPTQDLALTPLLRLSFATAASCRLHYGCHTIALLGHGSRCLCASHGPNERHSEAPCKALRQVRAHAAAITARLVANSFLVLLHPGMRLRCPLLKRLQRWSARPWPAT